MISANVPEAEEQRQYGYPHLPKERTVPSPRQSVLNEALQIVTADRNQAYGDPEDNFQNIAEFWNVYLNQAARSRDLVNVLQLTPFDVAQMMSLMKKARAIFNPGVRDNIVDDIGYMACAADCAHV